ncbi:hypothetical protein EDC96DRAFT_512515 [Choanephora cucurbitarum]|nr:hypothetical protein EDC96DRAFT_512515 [Choanephora cucurbitarum]
MSHIANEKALKASFDQKTIPNLKKETNRPEGISNKQTAESPNKSRFNDYEISLHPTCPFPDKQQQTDEGYLNNTTNEHAENTLEDNLSEKKTSFSRRPSQLSQDLSFNALCPPSHVLKARRLSKNTIKASVSTPIISSTQRSRKPSFVDGYQKEFISSQSAVSPRFMALRKLSEVTSLPSHSLSFAAVPPVPQIPSNYQPSAENKEEDTLESRMLSRIDDIIETQLQFHLGQIVWRASENHLEARRFWEEQKKDMLSFAANVVDRMESQMDIQRKAISASERKHEDHSECRQSKLSDYPLFEFEVLKTRNTELERQHELDLVSLQTLAQTTEAMASRLKALEQPAPKTPEGSVDRKKLYDLETENKQLKSQIQQMQEINQQLLEEATAHENKIKTQNKELRQLKHQLAEAELTILNTKRRMKSTSSTSTVSLEDRGIDCSEDFGKKTKKKRPSIEDWADMMQSEDEAKKTAEEWALKYKELQLKYHEVCTTLEENNLEDLTALLNKKDEEIRHLKQAENVNRIQIDYLQLELDKYQKKSSTDVKQKARRSQPPRTRPITPVNQTVPTKPSSPDSGYITEDGYLTFTTEINGKPSRYSIKIPQKPKEHVKNSKLNPNASAWKKQQSA